MTGRRQLGRFVRRNRASPWQADADRRGTGVGLPAVTDAGKPDFGLGGWRWAGLAGLGQRRGRLTVCAREHGTDLDGSVAILQVVEDGERLLPGSPGLRGLAGGLAGLAEVGEGFRFSE